MIFLGIFFWGMFVVARVFIFAAKIDVQVKKKVWPVIILALGATIIATAYGFHVPTSVYVILVPVTVLIVFINLRGFYFCEKCDRMIAHKDVFKKPEKCGNCRASL